MIEDYTHWRPENCQAILFAHTPPVHPLDSTEISVRCGDRNTHEQTAEITRNLEQVAIRVVMGFCIDCPHNLALRAQKDLSGNE